MRGAGGGRRSRSGRCALAAVLALGLAACEPSGQAPSTGAPSGDGLPAGPLATPAAPVVEPPEPSTGGPTATPAAPRAEGGFLAPDAAATWPGAGGEVATATALRAATHEGFDRLVLELDRHAAYRVAWLDGPPIRCGSGEVATLPGEAHLEMRLEPAKAHDEAGALTLQTRELRPALPAVRALALTCDFEAVLTFALGAPGRLPFRVTRLDGPPRLVVDVRHPDAAAGGV